MLQYEKAYASINSGFEIPNRNNAVISGKNGSILFGDWFFCTSEVTLLDRDGKEIERSVIDNRINGYEYEIEEVNRCLNTGSVESALVPHSSTLAVMRIMDKCRSDWGMRYRDEKS